MGTGLHGGFGKTLGRLNVVAGSLIIKSGRQEYFDYMANRSDIDPNGYLDIVAHGFSNSIIINHNGLDIEIDSRIAASLIKRSPDYKKGQNIRLLSCDTGRLDYGFAQHLANKLGITIIAPTKKVWALENGSHFVADAREDNPLLPDIREIGKMKSFKPGGNYHGQK